MAKPKSTDRHKRIILIAAVALFVTVVMILNYLRVEKLEENQTVRYGSGVDLPKYEATKGD